MASQKDSIDGSSGVYSAGRREERAGSQVEVPREKRVPRLVLIKRQESKHQKPKGPHSDRMNTTRT